MKQQLLIKLAKEVTGFKTNQEIATWLKISLQSVKMYQASEFKLDGAVNPGFRKMPDQLIDHILTKIQLVELDKEYGDMNKAHKSFLSAVKEFEQAEI